MDYNIQNIRPSGVPLRKFAGILDTYETRARQNDMAGQQLVLNFKEVEVFESDLPWPYPTFSLTMNVSDDNGMIRENSTLGKFIKSINQANRAYTGIADVQGKKLHIDGVDNSFKNRDGETVAFKDWLVISIGEEVTVDPEEELLKLIDGKDNQEIVRAVSANPVLSSVYLNDAIEGTLTTKLVEAGKITANDNGQFSVV